MEFVLMGRPPKKQIVAVVACHLHVLVTSLTLDRPAQRSDR